MTIRNIPKQWHTGKSAKLSRKKWKKSTFTARAIFPIINLVSDGYLFLNVKFWYPLIFNIAFISEVLFNLFLKEKKRFKWKSGVL